MAGVLVCTGLASSPAAAAVPSGAVNAGGAEHMPVVAANSGLVENGGPFMEQAQLTAAPSNAGSEAGDGEFGYSVALSSNGGPCRLERMFV